MKTIATIILMLFSLGIYAQEVKPEFEREGNLVKATFYHDNGKVSQTGYLKEGKLHGEWIIYNQEGIKIAVGEYSEGKRTGDWFFRKSTGESLREVAYVDGRAVRVVLWHNSKSIL